MFVDFSMKNIKYQNVGTDAYFMALVSETPI